MAADDPYKTWLEDFRREVDALASAPPAPSVKAGRDTEAAFSTWWKSEFESLLEPAPCLGAALPDPAPSSRAEDRPVPSAAGPVERPERSEREKAALESELGRLARENTALRQQQEGFREKAAQLDAKITRALSSYESALARVETQVGLHEERIQALRQDKTFTEQTCASLETRAQGLEVDLRQATEKAAATERDGLEARRGMVEAQEELQRLRLANAATEATIAELREQASVYRERLVESQEHTGSDVAILRQELREFLVKIKRLLDEAAGRAP